MSIGSGFANTSSGISDSEHIYKFPSSSKRNFTFPSPFFDLASQYMPRNIKDMFKWVEHIHLNNGIVTQCIERITKYPITQLQFEDDDEDVVEQWETLFYNKLHIKSFISDAGMDLYNYGNSFISIFFPFDRILKCEACKLEMPIKMVYNLTYKDSRFLGKCRCGRTGALKCMDRRSIDIDRVNLIRWSPKDIDISYNPITGKYDYFYKIPMDIVGRVRSGDINLIASLPKVFLNTIHKNKVIKLSDDYIFHMKTTALAGLNQEWGVPPTFRTFKLHYYNAILRRANEAIALDYLVPIRVMFPDFRGVNNPAEMLNMGKYKSMALNMIKQHRSDPGDAYFVPFPLGYQSVGAEMKALNINAEIKLANEEIMNSLGFPQELFYGSLTIQAAPVALRLLENTLTHWIDGMNGLTQWLCDKLSIYFDIPKTKISWAKVTLVDDLERKNILMQLVGAQKIADDTFLSSLGTSMKEEIKKKYKQQMVEMEEQKKFEERVKHLQQAEEQDQGGGSTPQDVQQQASQLAEKWLNMDYSSRKKEMNALSQQDEMLYSLAKEVMARMRRQGGSEAQQGES